MPSQPQNRVQRCTQLLSRLVATDTANPMGQPYPREGSVECQASQIIESLFRPHRAKVALTRQPCSPHHENLLVHWEVGATHRPVLFESHIDTVPAAAGWVDRAWTPRVDGDRLLGLGACDDKGCLTAMILALLELLEQDARPPRSILLLCAGDEEYAQTGIRSFLAGLSRRPACGIFGEPTRLRPVIQHKGTVRWDITVHGRSAHTAQPELGVNAIHGMMEVIAALRAEQEGLRKRCSSPLLTGPTLTVTQISGGRTRNAVPDACTIAVDLRVLPGMDPAATRREVIDALEKLELHVTHGDVQLMTPPLATATDSPLSRRALAICREVVEPRAELQGAPYGTDAAWAGDDCPALVIGPGDIRYAHAVDEEISLAEVARAVEVYQRLMLEPFEELP